MTDVPKCPRCDEAIEFSAAFSPSGSYVVSCGCFKCNLVVQSRGRYSLTLTDEELDKIRRFERDVMMRNFERTMRDHGIVDKESADRYLQKCWNDVLDKVKE